LGFRLQAVRLDNPDRPPEGGTPNDRRNENQPRRNEEHEDTLCSFFVFFVSSWLIFVGGKMSFLTNLQEIRERARQQIDDGAVTKDYRLNREQAISVLNEALATEIVCVLRYRFHYYMATGIHSQAIKDEFLEHANDEQEHASRIAERIKQLGGKPEMNPAFVSQMSHSEYKEGVSLTDMIREDLIAERIAIETYREIVKYFGEKDPTSRIMMEEILAKEEEHADEMADLLFATEPQTGEPVRSLYFKDEIPNVADAGSVAEPAQPEGKHHRSKTAAKRG
jgi:bacterioferritin